MEYLDFLIELHKDGNRQGPGSAKTTQKAINLLDLNDNKALSILDLGCGTGGQTLVLAEQFKGQITGVDFISQFLDRLNIDAKARGYSEKIKTLECSMDQLQFNKETFDLIWSEGAIYNMGFEKGIAYLSQFLKPKGFLAVSEITWLTQERPNEIDDFWLKNYSEIDLASNKIKQLENQGYKLKGYFYLSESCWLDHYYLPLQERLNTLETKYKDYPEVMDFIQLEHNEFQLYQKYKDYYSYGFYIAQK